MTHTECNSTKLYRLDRFEVPLAARDEFLARVTETHALLRAQPGFIQDIVIEQPGVAGAFNLATLVEWRDELAVAGARAAVMAMHHRTGFRPDELFARLGVVADLGLYQGIQL